MQDLTKRDIVASIQFLLLNYRPNRSTARIFCRSFLTYKRNWLRSVISQ